MRNLADNTNQVFDFNDNVVNQHHMLPDPGNTAIPMLSCQKLIT